MHPLQVLRDEVDPVTVLDAAIRIAIAFLPLDPHPVLRDEALDVPVVLTKVRQDVIDALLVNFPAAMTVHLPSRHLIIIEQVLRHERCLRVRKVFLHLDPSRLIVIDTKQVDRVCRDRMTILLLHEREGVLFLQQFDQFLREGTQYRWIQERAVEQDVRQMSSMKVRLVPASRIGRRQVEDDANLASLARLLIRLDGKGTR